VAPAREERPRPGPGGAARAPASDDAAKAQELAKKLSNPVASLISFAIQMTFDYG
jgi:hypothetical protein